VAGGIKGIRPYSRSEDVRLHSEAEELIADGDYPNLASEIVERLRELLPRETAPDADPAKAPGLDYNPLRTARFR
jgi:hypothetical protein